MEKRTRTTRRPPEEKAMTYLHDGNTLILTKAKDILSGCDGCYFDQGGRCLLGDDPGQNSQFDCTVNGGDEIFKQLPGR